MPPLTEIDRLASRRRNASETKARILEAAQRRFAAHGYAQAGMREIAADVGVAVSLLVRHFGSKADLFEAALVEAMNANPVLAGPRRGWGRAMIDYMLGAGDVRLPAMVVLSTGDAEAREITARVMRERVITELADQLGPPDARARAIEITMLSTGFLVYGRQLPVGELDERTRRRFAGLLQATIDESAPT